MHFSRYARNVVMIVRGDSLKATLSYYLIDRINSSSNIKVLLHTELTALHGTKMLEAITLTNRLTGVQETVRTRWLFICIGGDPNTEWAAEVGIVRDEGGLFGDRPRPIAEWAISRQLAPGPCSLLPGNQSPRIAAGDVRHNSVKRCASAVGEGAMAVTLVHRYLSGG
jgi:thioredoxin reductase (NADPH)